MTEVGEDIKAFRAWKRWSQAELARALGTDAVTVSRWERGVSIPRRSAVHRLRVLGLGDGPKSHVPFSEDPAVRLRRLDEAHREQLDMKRRVRIVG